nr:hypothetical protein [Tanacetum cinerariifolium]
MLEGDEERIWDELYRLETSMEDVEGCLWCHGLYGAKGKDVAIFRTKKWIVVLDTCKVDQKRLHVAQAIIVACEESVTFIYLCYQSDFPILLRLASAAIFTKIEVLQIGTRAMVIENKSSNHPIIIPSDFYIEDAFSSTNSPNYLSVFLDYFPTIPRNISLNDLTMYLLDIQIFSPLLDDPYIEAMQAYNAISPPQVIIALPAVLPPSPVLLKSPISDSQDFFPFEEISPKDTETSVSHSSSVGTSSPIRIFFKQSIAAIKGYTGGSRLETSMEDAEGCLWCRGLYGAKRKDVAIFRTKKWIVVLESDIGDCNNTGDGGKTAGRAIITWGGEIALYACMASIYGSSCKGEKISMSKIYLVKSLRVVSRYSWEIVREYRKIVRRIRRGKSILNVEIRWDDNRVVG